MFQNPIWYFWNVKPNGFVIVEFFWKKFRETFIMAFYDVSFSRNSDKGGKDIKIPK